ncbi:MAG TPA: ATP-dependent DNA helicase, partial [Eoetvoesiella sp.]
EHAARELRLVAAPIDKLPGRKATFDVIPNAGQFDKALEDLLQVLDRNTQLLNVVSEKHPDLAAVAKSCMDIRAKIFQWSQPDRQGNNALKPAGGKGEEPAADDAGAAVRWVEHSLHHMRLHSAPLSVAQIFSRYRRKDQAWVLTSATLSVRGDFGHFLRQLGLWDAKTRRWESPFDYPSQGVLFVPKGLPLPSDSSFNEKFVATLLPLIKLATGGVLILCTSLRAVDQIAELLGDDFDETGIDRVLLRQGESSRGALLERFRTEKNAVLVGSASFWEGIDVPGDALTLVAIDKLPFAPPDDPVLEARLKLCRDNGGNPFMEYQLPEAAIALKQGAGRLIRSEKDWGVLMVGDTRMVEKPYGKLLWRGLPAFSRTRELAEVLAFYQKKQAQSEPAELSPLTGESSDSFKTS